MSKRLPPLNSLRAFEAVARHLSISRAAGATPRTWRFISWLKRAMKWAVSICVGAGFHTTTFPISAGAVGRFPAIAVKLNGVIA